MQAVVLAAGKGTRLKPLTSETPKPLVDVCGKPLIERIFESLPDEIDEILVVVSYLREQIEERFGNSWNGKPVRYVVQEPLSGTGGAVHLAKPFLHDRFLVVNGDDLYAKEDLTRLAATPLGVLVRRFPGRVPSGALIDEDGRFLGLAKDDSSFLRVCGAYALDGRFFAEPLIEIHVSVHQEYGLPQTLANLAATIPVHAVEATFWQPVGTHEELERAKKICG